MSARRPGATNPVLCGDFPDPDVLRIGDDYWLITSTFEFSPGMAVLHSRDLVTWRFTGHCIPDMTALGEEYSAERQGRDGRGMFAGCLVEHEGRVHVYFTTLDEGLYLVTADSPLGPWDPPVRVWDALYWDDPYPFWDDDGRAWMLASRPGDPVDDGWMTYLMPMAWDGRSVDPGAMRVLDPTWSSEANKMYKIDGSYYVLHNESRSAGNRVAVILRSTSLDGPWEKRLLVRGTGTDRDREPNQGSLVTTPAGDWWFLTHHGRTGYADGRVISVLPVTWEDGWPVAGVPDPDGEGGVMAWDLPVPAALPLGEVPGIVSPLSADFTAGQLGPQWEWHYHPPQGSWALDDDGLHLIALPPVRRGDVSTGRAMLTQRVVGGAALLSVDVDLAGSAAGLALAFGHLGGFFSALEVLDTGEGFVVRVVSGPAGASPVPRCEEALPAGTTAVQLVTGVDDAGYASYAYRVLGSVAGDSDGAVDDAEPRPLGDSYPTAWLRYWGSRVAMTCTASGVAAERAVQGRHAVAVLRRFRYERAG